MVIKKLIEDGVDEYINLLQQTPIDYSYVEIKDTDPVTGSSYVTCQVYDEEKRLVLVKGKMFYKTEVVEIGKIRRDVVIQAILNGIVYMSETTKKL